MVTQCNECGSENVVKAGFAWRNRKKVQRFRCKDCGKVFAPETEDECVPVKVKVR